MKQKCKAFTQTFQMLLNFKKFQKHFKKSTFEIHCMKAGLSNYLISKADALFPVCEEK